MKLKKGKGLRFGYYSNSPDFLDLLSFQTTLVIGAKINKIPVGGINLVRI